MDRYIVSVVAQIEAASFQEALTKASGMTFPPEATSISIQKISG